MWKKVKKADNGRHEWHFDKTKEVKLKQNQRKGEANIIVESGEGKRGVKDTNEGKTGKKKN